MPKNQLSFTRAAPTTFRRAKSSSSHTQLSLISIFMLACNSHYRSARAAPAWFAAASLLIRPAHATNLSELQLHLTPLERNRARDFVAGQQASLHPVVDCARPLAQPSRDLGFTDVRFNCARHSRLFTPLVWIGRHFVSLANHWPFTSYGVTNRVPSVTNRVASQFLGSGVQIGCHAKARNQPIRSDLPAWHRSQDAVNLTRMSHLNV